MRYLSLRTLALAAACTAIASTGVSTTQQPTPTPALDRRGLPLPFGVQPYYLADVPLGSGPHKAVMSEEKGLGREVVYSPKDLAKLGARKLPIVLWANGSCLYAGNRYRQYLTEIASHGYLVISGGPMGDKELEVGPQQNPVVRGGARATAPAQAQAPVRGGVDAGTAAVEGRVTAEIIKEALDWAFAQNADRTSRFFGRVDTRQVVSMGHSCGGVVAIQVATTDSRVTSLGVWASGLGLGARGASDPNALQKFTGPVLLISGTAALDIAYGNAKATFEQLHNNSVFYGWRDGLQHIGTFGAANGGELGTITVKWLDWQTRNDASGAKWFKGAACVLCKDSAWHIEKKKIDR